MFILSSVSRGLELRFVNDASIDENSQSNVFKNVKFLGEISNNGPNDFLVSNRCIQHSWFLFIIIIDNNQIY